MRGVLLTGLLMIFCCGGGLWILSRSQPGPGKPSTEPKTPAADGAGAQTDEQPSPLDQIRRWQEQGVFGEIKRGTSGQFVRVEIGPMFRDLSLAEKTRAVGLVHRYMFDIPDGQELDAGDARRTVLVTKAAGVVGQYGGDVGGLALDPSIANPIPNRPDEIKPRPAAPHPPSP